MVTVFNSAGVSRDVYKRQVYTPQYLLNNFLAIFITAIIVSGIKGTHINNTNATLKLINDTTTNNVSGANAL